MSRIEELINMLCPDGVEFKALWEVTIWDKKFSNVEKYKQPKVNKYYYYLAKDINLTNRENGNLKVLTTNKSDIFINDKYIKDKSTISQGEIVCLPWGGNPIIQYFNGRFITTDNRIATSNDLSKLNNKYLYYILVNKLNEISSFYRGSGIKHPDMSKVLNLSIPVPPLEIQKEIVRILDNFTKLINELTNELTARKKQYDYYRNKLLTFDKDDEKVRWVKLGEIANFRNGRGHEKIITSNINDYIVVNSKFISTDGNIKKYCSQQLSPLYIDDILIVMSDLPNGKALAKTFIIKENDKYTLNQRIGAISVKEKDKINTRFLSYSLNRNKQLLRYDNGVDQTNLKTEDIKSVILPIPSIEIQEQIVEILDRFEQFCNDLTEGLPAEIEARRKQYEYYRDKLLTFKEKKA